MGRLAGWTIRAVCAGGLLAASLAVHAQGIPPNMQPETQPPQGGGPPPGYSGQWPPPKPSAAVQFNAPGVPATAPTTLPLPVPVASVSHTESSLPARRARVRVEGGLVTVSADNSSLNQILREIARLTGIKITGGVTDERVYGSYGPAELPLVLATLLDGTGSNMMLSGEHLGTPQELTLTPRQGGATPPSVMSGRDASDADDVPPQETPRVSNQKLQGPAPPDQTLVPRSLPPADASTTAPAPDAAATPTTAQSPNGVKTPQEIYDQLMKMQQQTSKPPAPQ